MSIENITLVEKVAYFITELGEEVSSKIFLHLNEKEVTEVTKKIIQIQNLNRHDGLEILREMHYIMQSNAFILNGGTEAARSLLTKTFGGSEANHILEKLLLSIRKDNLFGFAQKIKPATFATFLQNENPQTIAIIMSHLEEGYAGEVMLNLNPDLVIEVSIRIANLKDISPTIIQNISMMLERKLEKLSSNQVQIGGARSVANIFNKMGSKGKETIDLIEMFDVDLSKEIKENMFTFDDIVKIVNEDFVKIKPLIDKSDLAIALKGAKEEVYDKFLQSFGEEEKQIFEEEFNYLKRVKQKDIDQKQAGVLETISRLLEKEEIELEEAEG
ncbi:flagellar motor switch protein FliG [bacterium]|jgi:flagellar motor switch protein FliG|nr:flagellar motor switch protein FliG [bacterium]